MNFQIYFKFKNILPIYQVLRFESEFLYYSSTSNISLKTFDTLSPESIDSNGSFRKRRRKHKVIIRSISFTVTFSCPLYAAYAFAARFVTMSPLRPSASNWLQTSEILTRKL